MRTRRYYAVRTAVRWAIWGPVGLGVARGRRVVRGLQAFGLTALLMAPALAPTLERML